MKATLFRSIICAALIVFAVGCGKDNKSSGGGNVGQIPNPNPNPYTGQIPAESQAALTNFQNWYNSQTEGTYPGLGQKIETRTIDNYSQTDGCESQPISFFGRKLLDLNYCLNTSSKQNSQNVDRTINVVAGSAKSQNSKLVEAYSGAGMTLANVLQGQSQFGTYYQLEYVKTNGHRVVYTIDTGIHSSFNPVQITNSETRTLEFVSSIR